MEVFAGGAVNKGDVTVKLATASRICVITDKPYPHRDLVNYWFFSECWGVSWLPLEGKLSRSD